MTVSSPNYVYVGRAAVCAVPVSLKRALDALESGVMSSFELPDTDSGSQTPQGPLKAKHMLLTTELCL